MPICTFNTQYSTNSKLSIPEIEALREERDFMLAIQAERPLDRKEAVSLAAIDMRLDGREPQPRHDSDDLLSDLEMHDLTGAESGDVSEVIEALTESEMEVVEGVDEVTAPVEERSIKVTEPVKGWSIKVTSESPKPLSIKVTERKRRSDKKGKQALDVIRKFVPPPASTVSPSFSSDLSPPISPSPTDTSSPLDRPPLCVWDLTDDRMKLVCATIALQVWEKATSWTFNLTPDARKKAMADPKGFIRSLTLAFNRALKRRYGYVPLYWLSADINQAGRLHLHGAIALGPDDDLALLQEVMIEAWGAWNGRGKNLQVDLNPQRCDDGWAEYAIRNSARVRAAIGADHTFYIPDELRARGEFIYGELRETVR